MAIPSIPCPYCDGTGQRQGNTCSDCGGDGLKTPSGTHEKIYAYTFDGQTRITALETTVNNVLDKCNDIKEKCDEIKAEQALQRVDLTNALEAIWNKVKDL